MLSKKMEAALNEQVKLEAYASYLYLSMSSWCSKEGLEGAEQFLNAQSDEERVHMLKIFSYINELDGHALVPSIKKPPHEFKSIQSILNMVYEHEKKVTKAINYLVCIAKEENDFTTENFLQWYVEEQREEETQIRGILDKVKLIGDGSMSLYYIDKELDAVFKARAVLTVEDALQQ